MKESTRMFYFVLYTILYEGMVWGLTAWWLYAGWSPFILILSVMLSSSQFKPSHFGLEEKEVNPLDLDDDEFERWKQIQKFKR